MAEIQCIHYYLYLNELNRSFFNRMTLIRLSTAEVSGSNLGMKNEDLFYEFV